MNTMLLALATVVIVGLIHFAVVDFRFRFAGGFPGIWLQNPAPPAVWIVRLTLIPPLLAALCLYFFGPAPILWVIIALLLAAHLATVLFLRAFPIE